MSTCTLVATHAEIVAAALRRDWPTVEHPALPMAPTVAALVESGRPGDQLRMAQNIAEARRQARA